MFFRYLKFNRFAKTLLLTVSALNVAISKSNLFIVFNEIVMYMMNAMEQMILLGTVCRSLNEKHG